MTVFYNRILTPKEQCLSELPFQATATNVTQYYKLIELVVKSRRVQKV